MEKSNHISVLAKEAVECFEGAHLKVFFDGTLGAGGHAEAFLNAHPEIEHYVGCDADPQALEIAAERLKRWGSKVRYIHGNFSHMDEYVKGPVDGFFLTWESPLCN